MHKQKANATDLVPHLKNNLFLIMVDSVWSQYWNEIFSSLFQVCEFIMKSFFSVYFWT